MTSCEPKVFLLTDGANLFHRQIRMTDSALGIDSMIGMALHLILYSMKKEYIRWGGTHCVFFMEGRSWRKDIYPEYKADRALIYAQQTEKEQEDHQLLIEAFDDFVEYLDTKTNVTVIQNPKTEADDMIAVWVEAHPDDKHILISSDSDFFQLLRHPNVTIYDPIKDILIKQDGIYNDNGKKLEFIVKSDAKIKAGKPNPDFVCEPNWFEWALFLKCVRGDKTDNIFSSYPGAREKGTKQKVGIREAYNDRNGQGYNWNNFMLQKFIYHDGTEHRVRDDYLRNKQLIDLGEIPEDIKHGCLEIIKEQTEKQGIPAVEIGHSFMKFCSKWSLSRIGNNANDFMPMMKARYRNAN